MVIQRHLVMLKEIEDHHHKRLHRARGDVDDQALDSAIGHAFHVRADNVKMPVPDQLGALRLDLLPRTLYELSKAPFAASLFLRLINGG